MTSQILKVLTEMISYVGTTIYQDGLYLFFSIIIAVCMSVYIDPEKIRKWFLKKPSFLVPGSVGVGALTPLCACGTMAVVLSLITSALPWGPIMAFLVSSPLMSPDTFVLLSGFMGINFAIALTIASIVLGLAAGFIASYIEKNSSYLQGQLRIRGNKQITDLKPGSGTSLEKNCCNVQKSILLAKDNLNSSFQQGSNDICCTLLFSTKKPNIAEKLKIKRFLLAFYDLGLKKVLPLFSLFVALAWLLKTYVPEGVIMKMFSGDHWYSVPLASVIGLPLYISDATIVPLLQVLKNAGASQGALLAFMITGPATSLGVIGGLSLIMKRKALLLYVLIIFFGAVLMGYVFDFFTQSMLI